MNSTNIKYFMDLIISISIIIFGVFIFYMTYKDGKKRVAEPTTSYIMHLSGYMGGFFAVIIGLIKLFRNL